MKTTTQLPDSICKLEKGKVNYVLGGYWQLLRFTSLVCLSPGKVVYIDTERAFNPHMLQSYARRLGVNFTKAAHNIRFSRTESSYQLYKIITESLEAEVIKHRPKAIILHSLSKTIHTDSLPPEDARHILTTIGRVLRHLAKKYDTKIIVTEIDSPKSKIKEGIYALDPAVIRLQHIKLENGWVEIKSMGLSTSVPTLRTLYTKPRLLGKRTGGNRWTAQPRSTYSNPWHRSNIILR